MKRTYKKETAIPRILGLIQELGGSVTLTEIDLTSLPPYGKLGPNLTAEFSRLNLDSIEVAVTYSVDNSQVDTFLIEWDELSLDILNTIADTLSEHVHQQLVD